MSDESELKALHQSLVAKAGVIETAVAALDREIASARQREQHARAAIVAVRDSTAAAERRREQLREQIRALSDWLYERLRRGEPQKPREHEEPRR